MDGDQFEVYRPFCKRIYRVDRPADLPRIMERAFHLSQSGRQGPVLVDVPSNDVIQLDLFLDYASNVALYPKFQEYFRAKRPPLLAVWGKNDPFFLPPGAEAFKRDNPNAEVRFFDTGHFALETHAEEIAAAIRDFLSRKLTQASAA